MPESASHFQTIDWIVLLGYFAGTMGIGLYFHRATRSPEGYTAANRSLPGWVCGLSIFATFLSSISYLALPGRSFTGNWNPFVFSLSLPLVTWIAVRWFLPYYREAGEVSAYAALESRFGLWARLYASCFYLLTQIARIAVVMYLMALPMQVLFGWNIYTILIVTGVCVTLYSFIGGIVAVIWTDAVQALVLLAGAAISLAVMAWNLPGGGEAGFAAAWEQGKFSLGSFGGSLTESTFWVVLAYGLVINVQNFGVDQSYVQRYIASGSDREARRSLWLGGLLYVPVSALFFLIGTTLFVFYQAAEVDSGGVPRAAAATADLAEVREIVARQRLMQQGVDPASPEFASRLEPLAAQLELGEVGDRVFPHFIAKHLPPGLTGLLVAAVFAAAMSTVSTSLNSSATLILSDFYRRLLAPRANDRAAMLVLYAATILWGVLGTLLSLWLVKLTEAALDIWWTLAGFLGGGVTGLFLLGRVSRRTGSPAALLGVLLGLLAIGWFSIPKLAEYVQRLPESWGLLAPARQLAEWREGWGSPLHAFLVPVVGTLVILLAGLAFGRFFPSAVRRDSNGGADSPQAER